MVNNEYELVWKYRKPRSWHKGNSWKFAMFSWQTSKAIVREKNSQSLKQGASLMMHAKRRELHAGKTWSPLKTSHAVPLDKILSHWHKWVKHIAFKIQGNFFFFSFRRRKLKKSSLLMRKGRKILKAHIIRNYPLGKRVGSLRRRSLHS